MNTVYWRLLAAFMGLYCATMGVNAISNATALLASRFSVSLSEISAATSYYLIAEIAALPLLPMLINKWGAPRVLKWALTLTACSSLLCTSSQTLPALLFSRIAQGFSCGLLLTLPLIIIKNELSQEYHAKALALMAVISGLAPITGPLITSLLEPGTVHFIFIIMALIALCALWILPCNSPSKLETTTRVHYISMVAVILFAVGLGLIVWAFENATHYGGFSDSFVLRAALFLGIVLTFSTLTHQYISENALLPIRRLLKWRYVGLLISGAIMGIVVYGFIYIIPYYLIQVHDAGVTTLFHVTLYAAVPQLAFLPVTLYLRKKVSPYLLLSIASVLCAFSVGSLIGIGPYFGGEQWMLPQALRAIAIPMIVLPLSLLLITIAQKEDMPALSSMYNLSRTLGGVIGITGMTTYTERKQSEYYQIGGSHWTSDLPADALVQQSWIMAFNDTFIMITAVILIMAAGFIASSCLRFIWHPV